MCEETSLSYQLVCCCRIVIVSGALLDASKRGNVGNGCQLLYLSTAVRTYSELEYLPLLHRDLAYSDLLKGNNHLVQLTLSVAPLETSDVSSHISCSYGILASVSLILEVSLLSVAFGCAAFVEDACWLLEGPLDEELLDEELLDEGVLDVLSPGSDGLAAESVTNKGRD